MQFISVKRDMISLFVKRINDQYLERELKSFQTCHDKPIEVKNLYKLGSSKFIYLLIVRSVLFYNI